MAKPKEMPECDCKAKEKYLVPRGKSPNCTAMLVCKKCITDADLAPYGKGARADVNNTQPRWNSEHQDWDDAMKTDHSKVG